MTFELPFEIERDLRREHGSLEQTAKIATLIEFYRQDKITRFQLSQALGISRFETDALLKEHKVTEDLPSLEELEHDLRQGMLLVKR